MPSKRDCSRRADHEQSKFEGAMPPLLAENGHLLNEAVRPGIESQEIEPSLNCGAGRVATIPGNLVGTRRERPARYRPNQSPSHVIDVELDHLGRRDSEADHHRT